MTGRTLGHYRIESKLGEGGMGVVYRATDIRLGRPVAIKVLRVDAAANPERRKRFEQEAKAASALNHPNIVTIHEIDTDAGVDFIAMEYVEGQTLDQLIGRKGLKLGETLKYAVQIADALAKAHFSGIVHRDLKPANVMVTESGLVKVLDFGLAKLTEATGDDASAETRTLEPGEAPHTQEGAILGTVAYMSPEQAEGRKIDSRSDIFSFGSVLYEMITGRPAFQGQSKISTLSAILHQEPKLPGDDAIPRELERTIARCLRKDLERRFQHMGDVKIVLQEVQGAPEAPQAPARRGRLPYGVALAVTLVAAGITYWFSRGPAPGRTLVLTQLTSDAGLTTDPALSPDGKLVAFASDRGGEGNLDIWVQQVRGGQAIRLTRHAADDHEPSFSPDGTQVVFRSERDGGGIYVVSSLGGEEKLIVRQGRRPRFSPDGAQIAYWVGNIGGSPYAPGTARIYTVASSGGSPTPVQAEFGAARYPIWAPDGKRLLFWGFRDAKTPQQTEDWWVAPAAGGAAIPTGAVAAFRRHGLRSQPGAYVIMPSEWAALGDRILFAARLGDSANLWLLPISRNGEARGAPDRLTSGSTSEVQPATAPGGPFVFSSLRDAFSIWSLPLDANRAKATGAIERLSSHSAPHFQPFLSTGGKRIVFVSKRAGSGGIWMKDLDSGRETALAADPSLGNWPIITADGSKAAYTASENQRPAIFVIATAGERPGVPEKVCEPCAVPSYFSTDGRKILYRPEGAEARVALLDLASGQKTEILKRAGYSLFRARFSPDDRWIAFHGRNRPGISALFVAPFRGGPVAEQDWIPVTDGESYDLNPAWSPDGNILYFLSERDGFRCIWAQKLEPATKRPAGTPFPILDFHSATRSLIYPTTNWLGLSVSRDRLVFNLADISGNIWMAKEQR